MNLCNLNHTAINTAKVLDYTDKDHEEICNEILTFSEFKTQSLSSFVAKLSF